MHLCVLALCLGLLIAVEAWPEGAPCAAIDSMTPNHKGGKFKRPPFKLRVHTSCYKPGISFKVSLQGKTRDDLFKGFVIQAHTAGATDDLRLGEFLHTGNKNWKFQCKDKTGDTSSITHTWRDEKNMVEALWSTPTDAQGRIRFIATVVRSYSTYWVRQVRSRVIWPCSELYKQLEQGGKPVQTNIKPRIPTTTTLKPKLPNVRNFPPPSSTATRFLSSFPNTTKQEIQIVSSEKTDEVEVTDDSVPAEYCSELADQGDYFDSDKNSCGGYVQRYYHFGGYCYQFWYGGCGGNRNNFKDEDACKKACVPGFVSPKDEAANDLCNQKIDEGDWCKPPGWTSQYAYDKEKESCITFNYAGCGGNKNRFSNMDDCVETCVLKLPNCVPHSDTETACKFWVYDDPRSCNEIGGSSIVRSRCKRSCCDLERKRKLVSLN